jgi:chromosomal replication initiation ATPase DnaA
MTAAQIEPAEDALLRMLLARLLADRQLAVAEPVQDWVLARLPRTPAAVLAAAVALDRAGLAAGARITRALAAEALAEHLASAPAELADHPAE